jgi:hypothetical protein
VLQLGVWAGGERSGDDLLFDEIARRWLKQNEVEDARGWRELLEQRFARLAMGVFDVYLPPAALRDGRACKDTGAALLALLDAQAGWTAWVRGVPREQPDEALARWLRGLGPKSFTGKSLAGADLAGRIAADEVHSALERYRTLQRSGAPLGVEREVPGVPLVLFPRRAEFVEFVCVAGALDPRLKPSAWNEGVTTWLEYQAWEVRFLTLEYAASEGSRDFERGVPVGARNPAALAQLVCQVATRSMLASVYADGLDPALGSGMANALVIDLHGELDTRIDGDVRSRSSQGTSLFIPGGNPEGGALPGSSAENRWRGTKGRDHFVGVLAQVQAQSGEKRNGKKGATGAERIARFELVSDSGSRKALVSAPFLGPQAKRPDAQFLPDYLELVRCYGIAFLHWLRLAGAGTPEESAARFGEFLRALGKRTRAEDLPRVLQELYGQPLSAASADGLFASPTLEGRFLEWLAKND